MCHTAPWPDLNPFGGVHGQDHARARTGRRPMRLPDAPLQGARNVAPLSGFAFMLTFCLFLSGPGIKPDCRRPSGLAITGWYVPLETCRPRFAAVISVLDEIGIIFLC